MRLDRVDLVRVIIAAVCLIGLFAVVLALGQSDRTARPTNVNGDLLGQDSGESLSEYVERAAASLNDAPAAEDSFALLTFTRPTAPAEAADVVSGIARVNAMVILSAPPIPLPEPVAGEDRADVFNREIDLVDASFAGLGEVSAPREINSLIVRDRGEALRGVARDPAVLAVEVLPPDAAWGRFGVRPVDVAS